ncbi:MAG TPA: thioredoxin family protein [Fimbriimonadaceae bacterium]|nr:thioredoxin family protein [Fimbriimonadaceae bacterium]HRJ32522.1 thioredoxin family protein [Fimbriimonadaceae bacterium]
MRNRVLVFAGVLALASIVVAQRAAQPTVATGSTAPNFSLKNSNGATVSLADFKGKYVVLEWTNNKCPFVVKHYATGNMQNLQGWVTGQGAVWLTICSSAEGKEGYVTAAEANDLMKKDGYKASHYLLDAAGTVGKAYGAQRTPHMFIIDPSGKLIYQGALDDNPSPDPETAKTAKNYVRQALTEAMAGKPVSEPTTRAYGCSVKYP